MAFFRRNYNRFGARVVIKVNIQTIVEITKKKMALSPKTQNLICDKQSAQAAYLVKEVKYWLNPPPVCIIKKWTITSCFKTASLTNLV